MMRTRTRRRSRAYLDKVLEGNARGSDPLIDLVQQLQAPPRRRETRGLRAASSAFVWAPTVRPYLPPHHRTGLSSAGAHGWHPKVLAGGLAFVAASAIAYTAAASVTSHSSPSVTTAGIAAQISAQAHPPASVSSVRTPSKPGGSTAGGAVAPASTPASPPASSAAASTVPASTDPDFPAWLCGQWIAATNAAQDNPLFGPLITLAGGIDSVQNYCNTLLASGAPPASAEAPSTPSSVSTPPGGPSHHSPSRPPTTTPTSTSTG